MKKNKLLKIILVILLFIVILISKNVSEAISGSDANAIVKYEGLSGARNILSGDPKSIVTNGKTEIASIYYRDMQNSSNDIIYCMEKGQHNANNQVAGISASPKYNILAYVEIKNGIATSYIYEDGVAGARGPNVSGYNESNRVLAQILSGEYGLGYGSGVNAYTDAQKALYGYFKEWRATVGETIGIDSSWDISNQGGDLGASTINAARAAVASGANPSIRFYLLDNYRENSWQRLMIAEPFENENGKITLIKTGEDGEPLANVGFKVKVSPGDLYIQQSNGQYIFVQESQATEFKTNGSGRIIFEGLPGGLLYTFIETKNPNSDYNIPENLGVKQTRFIEINETCTIVVSNKKKTKEEEEPPSSNPEDLKGSVKISGKVWEDSFTGKDNSIDNKYSSGDKTVKDVTVKWYTSSNKLIATTTTKDDGTYEMTYVDQYGSIILHSGKDGYPFEYNQDVLNELTNSYIVFEYNGLKYTTVAQTNTGENTSRGIEVESDRTALDNKFYEVTKNKVQTSGIDLTITQDSNGNNLANENNWQENFGVRATTQSIKNLLGTILQDKDTDGHYKFTNTGAYQYGPGYSTNYIIGTGKTYTRWCYNYGQYWKGTGAGGSDWKQNGLYGSNSDHKVGNAHWEEYKVVGGHYIDPSDPNSWVSDYDWVGDNEDIYCTDQTQWSNWKSLLPSSYRSEGVNWSDYISKPDHAILSSIKDVNTDFEIKNMNLGLVRLEQPDLALDSDINNVEVIMKGQKYTYYYGRRGIQNAPISAEFSNDGKTYTRPINPSDVAYVKDKETTELEVYITYDIIAKNQSTTLSARVGEIVNYYDKDYTLVSEGWSEQSKYGEKFSNGDYKSAYSTALSGQIILPQSQSSTISIKFKVNDDVVKGLLERDAQLMNVSEINVYSALYGENTRCSEDREAKDVTGRVGSQYAGIDIDSIPGNAEPTKDSVNIEDDTDRAPTFILTVNENKVISGTVWEDTQTNESSKNNERLGDGKKTDTEKGVQNVKVELLRAEDNKVADLYIKGDNDNSITQKKAITYTDENGHYEFKGVVVDNYIIKYTYGDADKGTDSDGNVIGKTTIDGGNTFINARNYKSTIITTEPVKGAIQGNGNVVWHLTQDDNTSVAVDDLQERLQIPELKYSNFDEPHNMTAYSAPFKVQVEYTEEQKASVVDNGDKTDGKFELDWTRFDFGIIERAREDIVIDKSIANIKITLANGQVLTEGDPRTEKLDYVKALGIKDIINTRKEAMKNTEKLLSIEMDSELIQGSTIDILYAITVTNNSENDYDYEQGNSYYYYGEGKENLSLITPTIDYVVDYMDSELTCIVGTGAEINENNKNWLQIIPNTEEDGTTIQPAYVIEQMMGMVSHETAEKLYQQNYLIFITDAFNQVVSGKSHTEYLFASKLLGNQEDAYIYENHTEIVQLNGKIARTIDSTENGMQIEKTYKPGNYIPNLTKILDEQDNDMITIKITPPTGLTTHTIMYVIIGAVELMILAIGIVIIKKKIR